MSQGVSKDIVGADDLIFYLFMMENVYKWAGLSFQFIIPVLTLLLMPGPSRPPGIMN